VEFLATPPYHGCFSTYIKHPSSLCFKLPAEVSTREGALIEPLSVGLEAAKVSGVTLGSSVIILGAGCIGLVTRFNFLMLFLLFFIFIFFFFITFCG
jgi:L-iditol 2-dehydrogenase